jgi:cystathionine beta-lyase family protein involved in aluminum resistance
MIPGRSAVMASTSSSGTTRRCCSTTTTIGAAPRLSAAAANGRRRPRPSAVVVARGERRSANRTKWTTGAGEQQQEEQVEEAAQTPAAAAAAASPSQPNQQQKGGAAAAPTPPTPSPPSPSPSPSPSASASALIWRCAADLSPVFAQVDRLVHANLSRVQRAFRDSRVGPHHFAGSTGYGHGDQGREALDSVVARLMGAEAAIVRPHLMSGTHAIAAGLFGVLRPGDELLAVAGAPYDTMEEVIGLPGRGTPGHGSLREWGVSYRQLELSPPRTGGIDWAALDTAVHVGRTRVVHVQRSCGYALRPTLSVSEIARVVESVKRQDPTVVVCVDNCYGEFTERREPCSVGADLVMGSLIKNAGGTLAPCGGYVAGKEALVRAAAARMSAPGVGTDAGAVDGATMRLMFQGLFMGPQATGEALKGGRLVAEVMAREGYAVVPAPSSSFPAFLSSPSSSSPDDDYNNGNDNNNDRNTNHSDLLPDPPSMITAVELGTRGRMVSFCRGIQRACPVGSYVLPEPGVTAGYADEVIFADGTFVDGSTAELSADGPVRPPYVVYCQGGTHWTHWALALESAVGELRAERAREAGGAEEGAGAQEERRRAGEARATAAARQKAAAAARN